MANRAGMPTEHHADDQGMEVGAVASPGVAGEQGVATTPSRASLVISHHRRDPIVDRPSLLGVGPRSLRGLDGQIPDRTIQGDQRFGTQITAAVRGAQGLDGPAVLPAGRIDTQGDRDRSLRSLHPHMKAMVAELRFPADRQWAGGVNVELVDRLVPVGLRQRQPEVEGLRTLGDASYGGAVVQGEGAGGQRGIFDGRGCQGREEYGQDEHGHRFLPFIGVED